MVWDISLKKALIRWQYYIGCRLLNCFALEA